MKRASGFQIATLVRWAVFRLRPQTWAIVRVLQWVASAGLVSRVRVSTASTWASLIVRGAPGRGSSSNPSRRLVSRRLRHAVIRRDALSRWASGLALLLGLVVVTNVAIAATSTALLSVDGMT